MPFTPEQLKAKLLLTVDGDNNVKDQEELLKIISMLEVYPITKEHLEVTRVGKLVNDVRRSTANKDLAKRLKKLVKQWQLIVSCNGIKPDSCSNSPASFSRPSTPVNNQGSLSSRSNTPINVPINASSNGSAESSAFKENVATRKRRHENDGNIQVALKKQLTDKDVASVNRTYDVISTPDANDGLNSSLLSNGVTKDKFDHENSGLGSSSLSQPSFAPKDVSTSFGCSDIIPMGRGGAGSRRKTNILGTRDGGTSDGTMVASKVNTTAELIQRLQKSGNMKVKQSDTLTKITTNQIEKEEDCDVSVVPAGAKPRPKRKSIHHHHQHSFPPQSECLSQIKSDMIAKFLESSVNNPSVYNSSDCPIVVDDDDDVAALLNIPPVPIRLKSAKSSNSGKIIKKFKLHRKRKIDDDDVEVIDNKEDDEPLCLQPVGQTNNEQSPENGNGMCAVMERNPLENCIAEMKLPTIVESEINWSSLEYEVPQPVPVNNVSLKKLSEDKWHGVNGISEESGVWHDWTSMISLPTVGSNQIHVLPYVCLDEY